MNSKELEILKRDIGQARYQHSLRVADKAKKLARIYGEDEEKAYKAGLLHDCGKFLDKELILKKVEEFGIIVDGLMIDNPELIHAQLGSSMAELVYGIEDRDILNSIKFHTTARKDMSCLEKIIFIADFIEPGRIFDPVEEIRQMAYLDLNKSIIMALDTTIKFLIDEKKTISTDSIEARNYLKLEEKGFIYD